MLKIDKKKLRKRIHEQRKSLDAEFQIHAAQHITQQLISLDTLQTARTVALYWAAHGEADPRGITQHNYSVAKTWLLPALLDSERLLFLALQNDDALTPNQFGIPEPSALSAPVNLKQIDLVLVPLVAFDAQCNRLGRGKGYYDKTLENIDRNNTKLIGVAYEFQHIKAVHPEKWDVPLDCVVTEKTIYHRSKQ